MFGPVRPSGSVGPPSPDCPQATRDSANRVVTTRRMLGVLLGVTLAEPWAMPPPLARRARVRRACRRRSALVFEHGGRLDFPGPLPAGTESLTFSATTADPFRREDSIVPLTQTDALRDLPPYVFAELDRLKAEARARG